MSTDTIRTFLRMRAREGCEQAFVDAWQRSAQEIGQVPGSVRQDLLVDADDPRSYLIVAEWTDRAALDAFGRSAYRDRLTVGLRDLRESAERSTYRVLTTVRSDPVAVAPDGAVPTDSPRGEEQPMARTDLPPGSEQGIASSDLFTPEFSRDPNPTYARLRAERPVCPVTSPRFDSFLITRYDDAKAALSDPRLSKDLYGPNETYRKIFGPNSAALNKNMLHSDPPEHTRLRRLVSQAFTPRRVEALRPRTVEVVEELVDAIAPRGSADLMHDFALPLPVTVICELLGVPAAEREEFFALTDVIRTRGTAGRGSEEDRTAVQDAQQALADYLGGLIARKRAHPAEDLLSALITARDEDSKLSERELVSSTFLLLFAGHQTTADFLGNAVVALLTRPDQLALLLDRPDVLPDAVEELLRFDGSVPVASPRVALEDVEYRGVRIPAGSIVTVVLTAANHDPEHFPAPDELDLTRARNSHLAFGHGVHFCLGVSLARMEAQIALGTLLRRLPDLALAVAPEQLRRPPAASPFRGLLELPVTFSPSRVGFRNAAT